MLGRFKSDIYDKLHISFKPHWVANKNDFLGTEEKAYR